MAVFPSTVSWVLFITTARTPVVVIIQLMSDARMAVSGFAWTILLSAVFAAKTLQRLVARKIRRCLLQLLSSINRIRFLAAISLTTLIRMKWSPPTARRVGVRSMEMDLA